VFSVEYSFNSGNKITEKCPVGLLQVCWSATASYIIKNTYRTELTKLLLIIWIYFVLHHHRWRSSLFLSIAVLRRFCHTCLRPSGFYFFGFRNLPLPPRRRPSALRSAPNLEDQESVFMFPQWQGGTLIYPHAPGSLFVAFYDSQGCGLHTGISSVCCGTLSVDVQR
jgi:hypothetical protein